MKTIIDSGLMDMKLIDFDNKCVQITTVTGEVYEGIVSYCSGEYVLHEFGCNQDALYLTPILFCRDDISDIKSLEHVRGPFGHYSEKYGLLEKKCLEWGTDMIEEVFESDDDDQKLRMLVCMNENFSSLTNRAVSGMAPWRSGSAALDPEDDEDKQGPVYLGELEEMLNSLVRYSTSEKVAEEAKYLLTRLNASEAQCYAK